jgi:hypothetical protein
MAEGFLDGAMFTSALTFLNLGRKGSHSTWHLSSVLETTYALLQDDMKIIPRPLGLGHEQGDYAIAAAEFPQLLVDGAKREAVLKTSWEFRQYSRGVAGAPTPVGDLAFLRGNDKLHKRSAQS